MIELNDVKRILRSYGMKEEYTEGGANILYCGSIAFRLINDYAYEWWPHYTQSSGTIVVCESIEDALINILIDGLIALNRFKDNY
jgi:hypothetical protein|uniref:Uncharacterized protein n=1 Tax=Podoviridae sp. cttot15 TaxID=2827751 RepID=A0A8S5TMD3_9CAUD|nr:MAG TPA: hypothetical protein [Podoviridae sp. cttot15]